MRMRYDRAFGTADISSWRAILSFLRGGPAVDEVADVPFRIFVPE
jgi:hypothetical protein